MENHKKIKLGEVASFINGYAFKPEDWSNTGLPIIRIQNLTGSSKEINYYSGKYPNKIEINNGDILISWSASIGIYIWNNGKALLNQHIFKVIFDKVEIEKKYFTYAVSNVINDMILKSHGATMKHIVKHDFENTLIVFPLIKQQQKIATILDKVSNLILLRKQQLEKLDLLVKSRFIEMFGDPVTNSMDWEKFQLKKVCIINPKKINDNNLIDDLEISFVPMTLVSEHGNIDTSIYRNYSEVKTGFTYFIENDVLFAKITPCMENGKGAIATGLKNKIGFGSTEFHVLRPILNKTTSHWIYYLMSFDFFRKEAERKMTGSAGQKRVPTSFLENYMVAVPPIDLQNQFADFVQQVEKQKSSIKKGLDKLELLKKALMQEYFG